MTKKKSVAAACCLLALLIASGCSIPRRESIQKQTYLLKVEHPEQTFSLPINACFNIRMARVAPAFAGSQLVYRTGPVTYEQDYYHTFLSAPDEQFDEIVKRWFRDSRQFVCRGSADPAEKMLTLESHLDGLYTDFENPVPEGVVQMHFYLSRYDADCGCAVELLKKSYTARTPVSQPEPGADQLVAAMSQSVAKILLEVEEDIAAQLRSGR